MAWGLELEDLQLFSRSLRRVAPTADIVLLAKDANSAARQLAAAERIQLAAGVPYAVIHQFDRHPPLLAAFQKKYAV